MDATNPVILNEITQTEAINTLLLSALRSNFLRLSDKSVERVLAAAGITCRVKYPEHYICNARYGVNKFALIISDRHGYQLEREYLDPAEASASARHWLLDRIVDGVNSGLYSIEDIWAALAMVPANKEAA